MMLTRDQITALVGIAVVVVSALLPETKAYLDIIAPAVIGLLALLLGIPAAERTITAVSAHRVEALRLQLAIAEQRVKG